MHTHSQRNIVCASVALALASAPLTGQAQDAPTKKECGNLVSEYVRPSTPIGRKAQIVLRCRQAERGLLVTPLTRALRKEEQRESALRLATQLRVPSLYPRVSKYLDSEIEDLVADYGASTWDTAATRTLWKRWKTTEPFSTSWDIANRALLRHKAPPPIADLMSAHLRADSARTDEMPPRQRLALRQILQASVGISSLQPSDLTSRWPALLATYEQEVKTFPMRGHPLLIYRDPKKDWNANTIGENVRITGDGQVSLPLAGRWQNMSFTLEARLFPRDGSRVQIGFEGAQGTWEVAFANGDWATKNSQEASYAIQGDADTWTKISYVISLVEPSAQNPNARGLRRCSILVNDEPLMQNGSHNGELKRLYIWVTKGHCTTSSVQIKT